ncbi:DedA family protein [Rhabdochlamydiaceae symbiont of Dictyostelium giganteum]|uniref:DedA family protein n=1 Tax=Rhabdochlamydiaceae symbiont of Dictyostelium giganteum TaxID=3342349 RepID=UPI00384B809E
MESLISWILAHAHSAHWWIFAAILLAGFNLPISADVLIALSALLALSLGPAFLWKLYLAIFLGCYFAGWIAYWIGRIGGEWLLKTSWFRRIFPKERQDKIEYFYHKYGFLTFLIGRFIPFGVRNCLFMSSGMSKIPFLKFALWDLPACFLWTSLSFSLFWFLGKHSPDFTNHLKILNLTLFSAFGVTAIAVLWYKRRGKKIHKSV